MKEKGIYLLKNEFTVLLWNLCLSMMIYMLCRLLYGLENYSDFDYLSAHQWQRIVTGGLRFDLSAVLYTNILLILLFSFPCHLKSKISPSIGKYLFVIVNSVTAMMNLMDSVYFKFTGRRTTSTLFSEFSNEGNLVTIIGKELINHWYLVLALLVLVLILWKGYRRPEYLDSYRLKIYYPIKTVLFVGIIFMTVNGMRGGFGAAVRPITLSNANQYVSKPSEAALVLNTPFSMLRTIGTQAFVTPNYLTQEEMNALYSPIHYPSDSLAFQPKNVVVLIVESFGKEYIGALNPTLEPETYQGYTPFVDSLIQQSLTFRYSYSNGRKSIDGMPSILSSIPMFVEPFFLTPSSMNRVSGLAGELAKKDYYTAFFHGAQNGSMGFQAFARATGFQDYFGRTEYDADERFAGDRDFDGTWAIWDEPFLQFYAMKMSEFKEPFMTAVFTASSHHPFVIPDQYKDTFSEGPLVIHKCIRYTDHALRKFFRYASTQNWYKNTLFVLTADHSNLTDHGYYQTDLGKFSVPIILFDPSGQLPTGIQNCVAQQIDIMPTILGCLHYDQPYVAFGVDLLQEKEPLFAVHYNNGVYQYVKNEYVLQFDGRENVGFYALTDSLMQRNLVQNVEYKGLMDTMQTEVKAIIQQYMQRMNQDRLVIENEEIQK